MSNVTNVVPGVEITLFSRSLTVIRSAVGVDRSMLTTRLLTQYVILVLLVSGFCGCTLHTILELAMELHL